MSIWRQKVTLEENLLAWLNILLKIWDLNT